MSHMEVLAALDAHTGGVSHEMRDAVLASFRDLVDAMLRFQVASTAWEPRPLSHLLPPTHPSIYSLTHTLTHSLTHPYHKNTSNHTRTHLLTHTHTTTHLLSQEVKCLNRCRENGIDAPLVYSANNQDRTIIMVCVCVCVVL